MSQYEQSRPSWRGLNFIQNLSLNLKFGVVGLLALFVMIWQAIGFYTVSQGNADFARKELIGNQVLASSSPFLESLLGAIAAQSDIRALDELAAGYQPLSATLNADSQVASLEAAVSQYRPGLPASEVAAAYQTWVTQVADQSNLILDPDLDSYYVMDAVALRIPALGYSLANLAASQYQGANSAGPAALFESDLKNLSSAVAAATAANPTLVASLQGQTDQALALGQALLNQAITSGPSNFQPQAFAVALSQLHRAATPALGQLLEARIASIEATMWTSLSIKMALALAAIAIALVIVRSIIAPVRQLNQAFQRLANGEMNQLIETRRRDEIGQMFAAFDQMQTDLRTRTQREQAQSAENARIKLGLDRASASVMLADNDNRIIYMNDAAQHLFHEAQADFRAAYGSFNPDQLIGSNMDQFHRNAAHQQSLVRGLGQKMEAEVTVGSRTLALAVVPVIDEDGARIGTSVEWRDRTAEAQAEAEIAQVIESALAGNLKMRVPEEGKEGFFLRASQGLNQLLTVSDGVVTDIGRMMSRMAQGDLSASITTEYQGDFNRLKRDANESAEKIREVIERALESAELVTNGAQEIAQGNADLSHRTEEQASSLEETASSMEEMTSAIGDSASRAEEVNKLANEAQSSAQQGGEIVRQAVTAMSEINQSSKQIADIISVIDEIAFQTNLLALNAAVEAARAGEQGRGFAVVAGEVRSLAQRSAEAAKEIKELIRNSVEKVEAGSDLVNQSGETLQTIVMNFSQVASMIDEISGAFRQQRDGVEQVNQAVSQMDEMTQQNAALVEQVSATGESLSEQAREMRSNLSFFSSGTAASKAIPRSTPKAKPIPAAMSPVNRPVLATSEDDDWADF